VFVCDWYDRLPCHQVKPHDRTNGRIYKIAYAEPKRVVDINLSTASDDELVQLQLHKNDWWVRQSRRVLSERAADGKDMSRVHEQLIDLLAEQQDETRRLRVLWALHVTHGIDETLSSSLLTDGQEYIRAWAIQCELEDREVPTDLHASLVGMAAQDDSPVVRLYLASACQRMPAELAWPIVERLAQHVEDADDHALPQMYWYATEPLVAADKTRGAKLAATTKIPKLRRWIAQRIAADN
jgi:hypothetical protein